MKCIKYSLLSAALVASLTSLPLPASATTTDSHHRTAVSSPLDSYQRGYAAGRADGHRMGVLSGVRCIFHPYTKRKGHGRFAMGYRTGFRHGYIRGYRLHSRHCSR